MPVEVFVLSINKFLWKIFLVDVACQLLDFTQKEKKKKGKKKAIPTIAEVLHRLRIQTQDINDEKIENVKDSDFGCSILSTLLFKYNI